MADGGAQNRPDGSSGIALDTALLCREIDAGDWLAAPIAAADLVAYGSESGVVDEQQRFLTKHLVTEPPQAIGRHQLPAGTRSCVVRVKLERAGLPPRLDRDLELDVIGVVVPQDRDRWVMVPALDHTFYLTEDDDLEERFRSEVQRIVAARELSDHDWLRLLPPRDHQLTPITVTLEAGERGLAQRARSLRKKKVEEHRRKRALELLGEVATPLHRNLGRAPGPLVGREAEMRQLEALLSGQVRSSLLLVGREAAGKSALLHHWLLPRKKERLVFATSGAKLVAGMSGFGQWQQRLEQVLEAAELLDAVLYFPSFGELLGERPERGGADVVGALRPWVVEGRVRVVGELAPEGVDAARRRHVSLFGALHQVRIEPLTEEQTLEAVRGHIAQWAERSPDRPVIDPGVVGPAVELARRYMPYRAFPGKVVRFLKELRTLAEAEPTPPERIDLERAYEAFSLSSGIPAFLLREDRALLADQVVRRFRDRIVGQAEAVRRVVETICVVKARLQPEGKPLCTLLFVGPTGVGKTELARTLTDFLFSNEDRMVRFDMSEYADGLAAERLIAGTHDKPGLLTSQVRQQPFCVLLLDEIEKAHPAVLDLLLQVLGEGRLSDTRGKTTYFNNAIIILTSNLGASHQRGRLGLRDDVGSADEPYAKALHETFRPELINRLDRVITFHPLTPEEVGRVVRIALGRISDRRGIQQGGVELGVSELGLARLAEGGYSDTYGVRALRRHLDRALVDPVAELLATLGDEAKGAYVWACLESEEPCADQPARHRLAARSHGDLRLEVYRRPAAAGRRALRGIWGVVSLRRQVDGWLAMETALRVQEQIGMLRSQLALAAKQNRSQGRNKQQKKKKRRAAIESVDLERMRTELFRLSEAWDGAKGLQEDIHVAEQLALSALYEGDEAHDIYDEAEALYLAFKRAFFYVLVAERTPRDAITLLAHELDKPGLFERWLGPLIDAAPARRWKLTFHVRGKPRPDEDWPPERVWTPPRDAEWVRRHVVEEPGRHKSVVIRARGRDAALLLGLEAGLHRLLHDDTDKYRHMHVRRLALADELGDEDWLANELTSAPPAPPRKNALPDRAHDAKGKWVRVGGGDQLAIERGQYWERFEEIGLSHLLDVIAAGDEDALYSPQIIRRKTDDEEGEP